MLEEHAMQSHALNAVEDDDIAAVVKYFDQ